MVNIRLQILSVQVRREIYVLFSFRDENLIKTQKLRENCITSEFLLNNLNPKSPLLNRSYNPRHQIEIQQFSF